MNDCTLCGRSTQRSGEGWFLTCKNCTKIVYMRCNLYTHTDEAFESWIQLYPFQEIQWVRNHPSIAAAIERIKSDFDQCPQCLLFHDIHQAQQ